jgi:hypothetical protein
MPIKDLEARRRYSREWVARRRSAFFEDKVCVQCGSTEELQLDHKDPRQKISHNIWSWTEVRRLAEIAKCQVLCKCCHAIKSAGERALGEKNGQSKLTELQVHLVCQLLAEGHTQAQISRDLGLNRKTINDVAKGRTWSWYTGI